MDKSGVCVDNGTIDITDLVNAMGDSFDRYALNIAFTNLAASPYFFWVSLPVFSSLTKALLDIAIGKLSKSGIMQTFFLNTAIKKPSQAKDYVQIVQKRKAAKSKDELERLEKDEMQYFSNLVRITN